MGEQEDIRLTTFSHGSGCGCKIAPAILEQILQSAGSGRKFPQLVGGFETRDDAAVWKLNNEDLLLSTTDFFTPIVDNAYDFGRIAAANALSDIYAMGGRPLFALSILGFPVDKLPVEIASAILDGASAICEEADIPIAGGHSIDVPEPIFGLSVNGIVKVRHLKKNSTAKPGDLIFLTKPIGTGIISSALKRNKADQETLAEAVKVMSTLNKIGERLAEFSEVTAMTDVTGFGLLGHLIEMCEGSNVSAVLNFSAVKIIPGADKFISQFVFPDNTYRNWNAYEKKVSGITGPAFIPLCDPQTSGGLMFTVKKESEKMITDLMIKEGLKDFIEPIGKIIDADKIIVKIDEN
jgi:selenide, water dikinase